MWVARALFALPPQAPGGTKGHHHRCLFFGCFGRKIDGDSWFTWWFNHLPGKPIYFPGRDAYGPHGVSTSRRIHLRLRCLESEELAALEVAQLRKELQAQEHQELSASLCAGLWDWFGGVRVKPNTTR